MWRQMLLSAGGLLCAINIVLFLLLHLIGLLAHFGVVGVSAPVDALYCLMLPPSLDAMMSSPWTLFTYMFVQYEFGHMLLNLLWLWAFAYIIESSGISRLRVVAIYLLGGLAGALAYLTLASSSAPGLVGASAAISALMGWSLVAIPRRQVRLWIVGDVSLWLVVVVVLFVFIFGGRSGSWGSHAAHIAGLIVGCGFGAYDRLRGLSRLTSGKRVRDNFDNGRIESPSYDQLLDKVRRSGYGSLNHLERIRLFRISSNLTDKDKQ